MPIDLAEKQRQQYVVKANSLIQDSRYRLTLQQQRMIIYCISKIKPDDAPDTWYDFNLVEFANACGLDIDGGGFYYKSLKDDFDKLMKREWVVSPDGVEKTVSWIGDVQMQKNINSIKIFFNPNLQPYLFALKSNYTQYKLGRALMLNSSYSIKLYELILSKTTARQRENDVTVNTSLAELRDYFDATQKYSKWYEFERRILHPSVREINGASDELHLDYRTRKSGRNISEIVFYVSKPSGLQLLIAQQNYDEKFNR